MNPADVAALFPDCVKVICRPIEATEPSCYSEEEAAVERAVAKRKDEFRVGRRCAREALRAFGENEVAIPKSTNGAPVWPGRFVGSITHCPTWCGAALAAETEVSGLGFDIEEPDRFDPGLARRVLTDEERRRLEGFSEAEAVKWMAMIFSAKESVFKCLFPVIDQWFGFQEAVIRPVDNQPVFEIELDPALRRRMPEGRMPEGVFRFAGAWVITGAILRPVG
ncbi:MAG: 4'-phosphopantetheinyl transferase superfamily protein [Verrucomicrobiota bacterium]